MLRGILKTFVLVGCVSSASALASAQQVVHAVSGTVNNINLSQKTISVITDDGSGGTFKELTDSKTPVDFDKTLRADATAVDAFNKKQTCVIVYYFGEGDVRTAIALRDIGPGPFKKVNGQVVKFEGKNHSISIKDQSGAVASFRITESTVADTGMGAVKGLKFEPGKGDQVRVISTDVNGTATVLFIKSL